MCQFVSVSFSLFDILRYGFILNCLKLGTLHSRRLQLHALFYVKPNVFKGKINCLSVMGPLGSVVPTKQIR
jgi:hypothetical protein